MGCTWTHASQVSTPVERADAGEPRQKKIAEDVENGQEVDEPMPMKPQTLRKWSMSSLDSASSLLSLARVAAGHGGTSILKYVDKNADEVPETTPYIMKVWDEVEARAYQELGTAGDKLLPFVPSFYGEVDREDLAPELRDRYMRLSNVLHKFSANPNVMDCKLGVRSFSTEEVHKTKLREDLYQKLVRLDPSLPTEEERKAGACTKFRWMSCNDAKTTLKSLGFRIDGIENASGKSGKDELREIVSLCDAARKITQEFLPKPEDCDLSNTDTGGSLSEAQNSGCAERSSAEAKTIYAPAQAAAEQVLGLLYKLREAMTTSDFVRAHTFVGCSLLFVADAHGPSAGVYLIDFAHTTPLPQGVHIDHRSPWQVGSYEDGLLLGMDNIIKCWERVVAGLDGNDSLTASL